MKGVVRGVIVLSGVVAAVAAILILYQNEADTSVALHKESTSLLPPQTLAKHEPWSEQLVNFTDSEGYIPAPMISQRFTNGDALLACRLMLETHTADDEKDFKWCIEFLNSEK
ncbi:MAG: hypothetical protein QXU32_11675 [Nitrososphaerales archaeon]